MYIDFVIAQQIRIPRSVRIGLSAGRTDHARGCCFASSQVGGREDYCSQSGARRGRTGGGVEEVWSGREKKEKKCADKREKSRVARGDNIAAEERGR